MALVSHRRSAQEILDELDELAKDDIDWKHGHAFSLAYYAGDDVYDVAQQANLKFLSANALNVAAFPSLRRMQNDVVRWVADLLHGGDAAAGFMTSGGTESLLMAVKAARTRGAQRGIVTGEMVLPSTAHAAFEKGAEYFGVRSVRVPVGNDYRADVAAMAAAVTPNTVLLVASAPQYPQGIVDPVSDIAVLAQRHDVNCHVDACMGGITLPMMEKLGEPVPPFDFRIPGVTSISVDLHKYGYTAKGASVIVHRNKQLRQQQTFRTENWLGGIYASSGILGTKSGGPIAAAWAVMQYLGEDGYLQLTRVARRCFEQLLVGLRAIPQVVILGQPAVTLVAFGFRDVDAFAVGDALHRRGWFVDQQQPPPSLHCTINAVHDGVIDSFLEALRAAVDEVGGSDSRGKQKAYGSLE